MQQLNKYETRGVVIFAYKSFSTAGEYEVRFFIGDSVDGQGYACRGLQGLAKGFETSPIYNTCALDAHTTSNTITVTSQSSNRQGRVSSNHAEGGIMAHIPGLEHMRFAKIGL